MGDVYGTYTERVGTYNNFINYREGCTERIGTYNFETNSLNTYGERVWNVYGTCRNV